MRMDSLKWSCNRNERRKKLTRSFTVQRILARRSVVHSIQTLIANKIHFTRKFAEKLIISFSSLAGCVCVCPRCLKRCKSIWTYCRKHGQIFGIHSRSLCSSLCRYKMVEMPKWFSAIILVRARSCSSRLRTSFGFANTVQAHENMHHCISIGYRG